MKTENLFNMFNALLALELAEKTQKLVNTYLKKGHF